MCLQVRKLDENEEYFIRVSARNKEGDSFPTVSEIVAPKPTASKLPAYFFQGSILMKNSEYNVMCHIIWTVTFILDYLCIDYYTTHKTQSRMHA